MVLAVVTISLNGAAIADSVSSIAEGPLLSAEGFLLTDENSLLTAKGSSTTENECQNVSEADSSQIFDFEFWRQKDFLSDYEGMAISAIHITTLPIFDNQNPKENYLLYQWINRIHRQTRPDVIRQQLLLHEGDRLSLRLVKETERLLRENSYLFDALIIPHQVCRNKIQLQVITRDLWTLLPKISFSRKGGENTKRFSIEDNNILGSGKQLRIGFRDDQERRETQLSYHDQHVFGSRANLLAAYADTSDGFYKRFMLNRPFFSLDTRWSSGLDLKEELLNERIESDDILINAYEHKTDHYQTFIGVSSGLEKQHTRRWSFGFSIDNDYFMPNEDSRATLPEDRELSYPWFGFSLLEDSYAVFNNLNQLFRTEDIAIGKRIAFRLGYASKKWGSTESQWVFSTEYVDSLLVNSSQLATFSLNTNGRWFEYGNEFQNLIINMNLDYQYFSSHKRRWFFRLTYDYGRALTQDELFPLGGASGLRGYPSDFQLGDRRLRFNLEHRYFFDFHWFNLFRIGAAAFYDAGRVFGQEELTQQKAELQNIGFGLRFNSSKTNTGKIVHIDLAVPLAERDRVDNVQWLVTSKVAF